MNQHLFIHGEWHLTQGGNRLFAARIMQIIFVKPSTTNTPGRRKGCIHTETLWDRPILKPLRDLNISLSARSVATWSEAESDSTNTDMLWIAKSMNKGAQLLCLSVARVLISGLEEMKMERLCSVTRNKFTGNTTSLCFGFLSGSLQKKLTSAMSHLLQ